MFNAKQILDQLMQNTQGKAGMSADTASPRQKTNMGDLLKKPAVTGALSGVGGGLLAGLALGNKKARKIGGRVAALGGAVALGAVATTAYRNWQAKKDLSAPPAQNISQVPLQLQQPKQVALEFDALPAAKQEDHSRVMLAAIIAAAKCDGYFDDRERQMIQEKTEQLGDAEAVEWVQQEINKPLDVDYIAALAASPEMASEIYLASLIIIDEQNTHEKKYLDLLAEKLRLEPQLRMEIEQQLV